MVEKKSVPIGVKIISVFYYIGAVLGVIAGLLWIFAARSIGTNVMQTPFGALGSSLIVVGGIVFIGLGVFGFFVGRGLRKARPWARIAVLIFAALGILVSLISMVLGDIASNIPNLVMQSAIGGYLLFNKSVKKAFA
ncbi:MAG: hypothetical protein ABIG95_02875 [Candidatus Woesearchaeota archaeon]